MAGREGDTVLVMFMELWQLICGCRPDLVVVLTRSYVIIGDKYLRGCFERKRSAGVRTRKKQIRFCRSWRRSRSSEVAVWGACRWRKEVAGEEWRRRGSVHGIDELFTTMALISGCGLMFSKWWWVWNGKEGDEPRTVQGGGAGEKDRQGRSRGVGSDGFIIQRNIRFWCWAEVKTDRTRDKV